MVLIDLTEVGSAECHARLFEVLRAGLDVDVLWASNGAALWASDAGRIRSELRGAAIVEQASRGGPNGGIHRFGSEASTADRCVAEDDDMRRALVGEHHVPSVRIDAIPPCIGPIRSSALTDQRQREQTPGLPSDVQTFALIGRLEAEEQPLEFLDVARRWRYDRTVHFLLVGSGDLDQEVADALRFAELDNVTWLPFVEDRSAIYPLLSGLVVASRCPDTPLVVFEALAMGVPVLSTDIGDVRRTVEEHATGLVVRDFTGAALAEGLDVFRQRLDRLTDNARSSAGSARMRHQAGTVAEAYHVSFTMALQRRAAPVVVAARP
jgi:glycosyltransferase involved in cell wall biosynthesis